MMVMIMIMSSIIEHVYDLYMHYSYVRPPKPPKVRKKRRKKKFKRRRLPYHLVQRCRERDGNRPPRLDGSIRRQKKKNIKARHRYRDKLAVTKEIAELFSYLPCDGMVW